MKIQIDTIVLDAERYLCIITPIILFENIELKVLNFDLLFITYL